MERMKVMMLNLSGSKECFKNVEIIIQFSITAVKNQSRWGRQQKNTEEKFPQFKAMSIFS